MMGDDWCGECGGTGECAHCHGDGTLDNADTECDECAGTGTCVECDGTGDAPELR